MTRKGQAQKNNYLIFLEVQSPLVSTRSRTLSIGKLELKRHPHRGLNDHDWQVNSRIYWLHDVYGSPTFSKTGYGEELESLEEEVEES